MLDGVLYLTSEDKKKAKRFVREQILFLVKKQPGLTQFELVKELKTLGKNHAFKNGSSLFRYHLQPLAIEGKIHAVGKDAHRKWYLRI